MAVTKVSLGTIPDRFVTVDTDGPRTTLRFCPQSCDDLRAALAGSAAEGVVWIIPPAVATAIKEAH